MPAYSHTPALLLRFICAIIQAAPGQHSLHRESCLSVPMNSNRAVSTTSHIQPSERLSSPFLRIIKGDARRLIALKSGTVDLVVTSPPYWRKRDYELGDQIGQEATPEEYVHQLILAFREWRRVLRPTGSVFLNIGDTYKERSLAGIPGLLENAAREDGWTLRNRIIWVKSGGVPEPARNRLAPRYEFILHLTTRPGNYYYDLFSYSQAYGNGSNPGDVWQIDLGRNTGRHLAPFPDQLVERALILGCPEQVCSRCGKPRERVVQRTSRLDLSRPQARRAVEIAREAGLTEEHIAAIQATGISDAGKALKIQNGTGRNSARVKALASEAKGVLGGYFREFTFAKREAVGWSDCSCNAEFMPGVVLDPFMGTGTTLQVAKSLQRSAIGVDLDPPKNI